MEFKIVYYKDEFGNDPVHEFLMEISKTKEDLYAQTIKGFNKLRNRAYHKEPLSKHVEPGLWELRIKVGTDILRILYSFQKGQIIVLLHGFIKKDQKTPASEIEMARKRLKDLKIREET